MSITYKQKMLIFFIVGLMMFGISYWSHRKDKVIYELSGEEENFMENNGVVNKEIDFLQKDKTIMVDVIGEVMSPGLYELTENSRIADAVKAAGGLTEKADRHLVNMAMKLQDEYQINIPAKGEVTNKIIAEGLVTSIVGTNITSPTTKINNNTSEKININNASQGELTKLPGVGDAIAERIILYRQEQGLFQSIDEIKKVVGIGDKKFIQIKDKITVD